MTPKERVLDWFRSVFIENPITSYPGAVVFLIGVLEFFTGPLPGIKEDSGVLINSGAKDFFAFVHVLLGYGLMSAKDSGAGLNK